MGGPSVTRNPLSIAGAALTTASAVAFLVYIALEWFGLLVSPYAGLLGYLLVPAVFLLGLSLIPLGMWREARRRRRGDAAWAWPAIDFTQSRTRQIAAAVGCLTLVNIGIVVIASAGVVHYTESNEFCGQVCHTPMTPEFTAHAVSPHAEITCVSCHVSPGAKGLISAKMNGTRQLYLLAIHRYSRPIPEPLGRIPTAADTCARCHRAGQPDRDIVRTLAGYADDDKNTETLTVLTMRMRANHWHARPDVQVEYIATGEGRETIPYVKVTGPGGEVREYFAEDVKETPPGALVRMSCVDCHNRPAHTFSPTVDRAVDAAIARGAVSRDLPFVRREMIAALKASYDDVDSAAAGIASHLTAFYRERETRSASEIARAIAATQELYRLNVFPAMKITWGTYPNLLGHADSPGCFRCHDDNHKTRDGTAVRQDCEMCHRVQ